MCLYAQIRVCVCIRSFKLLQPRYISNPNHFHFRFTDGFTALFINHVKQISERRFL